MIKLSLHEASLFAQCLSQLPEVRLRPNVVKSMAQNLVLMQKAFPDVAKMEAKLFEDAGQPQENQEGYKEYLESKIQLHKNTMIEVDLRKIRYDDLGIGEGQNANHFPPHAVVALSPMIVDFQESQ